MEKFAICSACKEDECQFCEHEWFDSEGQEFICSCECTDSVLDEEDSYLNPRIEAWDKYDEVDDEWN